MIKKTPQVLLIGGTGFVGSHLAARISTEHPDWGLIVTGSVSPNIGTARSLDITDSSAVENLISEAKPSIVVHLAAQASVAESFDKPTETWQVNLTGSVNVFNAMARYTPESTLLYISSSDIYGSSFTSGMVSETSELQPKNPYAASKAAADLAAYSLSQTSAVKVIRARPFNHSGYGQRESFALSSFARQIVEAQIGGESTIDVGDLSPQRDFSHVDDVVDAYLLLISQAENIDSGEHFNICSGAPVSMSQALQTLIDAANHNIRTRVDPNRLRPSDIPIVLGDNSKIRKLGWTPSRSINDIARDLISYWRDQLT